MKLAAYSATDSATDSDLLVNMCIVHIKHADPEYDIYFDLQGHLQGQIQGQRTGYRITSRISGEIAFKSVLYES